MAEVKSASPGQRSGRPKKSQTRSRGKPKARTSSKPKRSRGSSNGKARTSSQAKKTRSSSKPKAVLASKSKAAGEAVEETAKDAGRVVSRVASKAKVPLVAGGAALAGAAGGIALGAHQAHRRRGIGGIDSDDLTRAARKVGDLGAQVGEIAFEVRRAREASNGNVRRSPVEVVLQGLTARHPRG
jgi:hypothetical protein